ncbi:hypothetical protein J4417_04710 [Candidatus Woesearchaeota archaeon]|nr:hypothetical protein [Candidatus Woesearchaeota archaeon]
MKSYQLIFGAAILVLIVTGLISAKEPYTDEQFEKEIGLEQGTLVGCDVSCSYDADTNTLLLTSNAYLDKVPPGMTINLLGGKIKLPGGTVSGFGTFKAGKDGIVSSLSGGELKLDSSSPADLDFEESVVRTLDGGEFSGAGKIREGKLILESGDLSYGGIKTFLTNAQWEGVELNSELKLLAQEGFSVGSTAGYLETESSREVYLSKSSGGILQVRVGEIDDGDITESPPPEYTVVGKPSSMYVINRWEKPSALVINGEEHVFWGDLSFNNQGQLYLPPDPTFGAILPGNPHMIDGVYVRSDKQIAVFFGKKDLKYSGSSITLGEKLEVKGTDFRVALSQAGDGELSQKGDFMHTFPIASKYLPVEKSEGEFSNERLIVEVNGGKVVVDPEKKTITTSGEAVVINGVNLLDYFMESGTQKYDYIYIGCGGANMDIPEKSCGEVDYQMIDGGVVDVVDEINTVSTEYGIDTKEISFGYYGAAADEQKTIDLEQDKVYALGYRGGSAAVELVGKEFAHQEWGHAGILFYKGGTWWVAEATGLREHIVPFEESLFNPDGKLQGIWEIEHADSMEVAAMAEKMAAAPYDYNPLTTGAIHCSEVLCKGIEAGTGKKVGGQVNFKDIPNLPPSAVFKGMAAGPSAKTPRWVLSSEELKPVYVAPQISLKEYCQISAELKDAAVASLCQSINP